MCDHSNDPGGREAAMVEAYPGAWCDPCIAPLVKTLNAGGIRTVASCCGHGKRPGKIALADRRELFILPDFVASRELDAVLDRPPAGDVERLRERLLSNEVGVRVAAAFGMRPHQIGEIVNAALDAAVSPPSDSQGDQERCKRCSGHREIVTGINGFTDEVEYEPCPDCNPAPTQVEEEADETPSLALDKDAIRAGAHMGNRQPEGGDDEDWPELPIVQVGGKFYVDVLPEHTKVNGTPVRRYIPAREGER